VLGFSGKIQRNVGRFGIYDLWFGIYDLGFMIFLGGKQKQDKFWEMVL
jgi:hypothetical protein